MVVGVVVLVEFFMMLVDENIVYFVCMYVGNCGGGGGL